MIDIVSTIAFEMQSAKGIFALLLGSGVSYTAKIPTGWAITLDLVRQVAAATGEDCGINPEEWYRKKFKSSPDYSELLDRLGSTQSLRQGIIRKYIEPTAKERELGEKQPTPAHRAIANLMAKGYIRVVLTTNFDKLLEQALSDLGVHPSVISSPDHISGAQPLVHSGPLILKLHGDYLDTRIRNTSGELERYELQTDQLLDRIFDEFGLIACGWSAEWDTALKAAIDRAPSRRYPMYFTSLGEPNIAARSLVKRRAGNIVKISGADNFFEELSQKIYAIQTLQKPEPRSVALAVAMLKEFITEDRHQIKLHDFINFEAEKILEKFESSSFAKSLSAPAEVVAHIEAYDADLEILTAMAYTAGKWCKVGQARQWANIVKVLAERCQPVSSDQLVNLLRYPGSVLMYAFCLGAIAGRRPQNFGTIVGEMVDMGGFERPAAIILNISISDSTTRIAMKSLPTIDNSDSAGSEHIANILRPYSKSDFHSSKQFDLAFAQLELALAFAYAQIAGTTIKAACLGRLRYDYRVYDGVINQWRKDYKDRAEKSDLYVMAALSEPPKFAEIQKLVNG